MYGGGGAEGIIPHISNDVPRCRLSLSLGTAALHPEKSQIYPLNNHLGGPQIRSAPLSKK